MIKNEVYLGLGSNLGDNYLNVKNAIKELSKHKGIIVKKISPFIRTEALADTPQPDYVNAVIKIETSLTPQELYYFTNKIEKRLGRTNKHDNKPRTIDIDLLLFGKNVICLEDLTIPHPLMHERAFVLSPMLTIAPNLVHPVLQEPMYILYKQLIGH